MRESDHTEHLLVERLHNSDAFIPELSLVAEYNGKIIGYILMTKVEIVSDKTTTPSLCLAPIAVHPQYQRQGIGSLLIKAAHEKAKALGYKSAVVLGHKDYYPKFGYTKASTYGISFPFAAPDEYCMAVELSPNGLTDVNGTVKFPTAFNITQ